MVRTRSAVREKMREFVPETSMSSGEPAAVGHKLRQARLSKFGVVKNKLKSPSQKYIIPVGKGKAIAIDSQSESDSDFDENIHVDAKSSNPRKKKVVVAKNDKFRAVGGNRKRPINRIYSDEGDSEGPTKGIKGHKSNSQSPSHKDWDLLMAGIPFFSSKTDSYNNESTILEIKEVLNKGQKDLFRRTCFGKFLDLENFKVQAQIVHNILFREVAHSRNDKLWVDLSGKIMRFGLQEFTIITGLNYGGSCNKATVHQVKGGLFDRYFARFKPLTRQAIHHRFIMGIFENDEDAVKIASLHLIVNFLMGATPTKLVDRLYVDLLDTSRANDYPWGKDVYHFTIQSLKGQCYGKEHITAENQKKGLGRHIMYRLPGFIIALQFWFYEVCSAANGIVCLPQGQVAIPRMLKWQCIRDHNTKDIKPNFLSLPQSKYNNIIPTMEECNLMGLGDYSRDRNQLVRNKLNLSSQSDIVHRLDMISSKQSSITNDLLEVKSIFTDFRSDVLTMLQTIQTAVQNAAPHDTPLDALDYDPIEVPTQMFEEIIRSASKQKPSNEPKNNEVCYM